MNPREIAEQRAAHMGPGRQVSFLLAFERARDDVALGADTEDRWLRMRDHAIAAALAGYVEGLASTRAHPTPRTEGAAAPC